MTTRPERDRRQELEQGMAEVLEGRIKGPEDFIDQMEKQGFQYEKAPDGRAFLRTR